VKHSMLIIARYCAFDKAPYAGSKTHNYYLKRFHKDFNVKLITIADPSDVSKLDFKDYGIDADVTAVDERPQRALFFLRYNWMNSFNYFGKTLGLVNGYVQRIMLNKARALKKQGYNPDVVVLEWTQTLLTAKSLKKIFPKALFVGSEHDVSFLRLERQYAAASGVRKIKEALRLRSLKKQELAAIRAIDMVVPHNSKDRDVLVANGIAPEHIHVIAPFFSDYGDVVYNPDSRTILFFGAMDRPENYESIIWFIEHVFTPYLSGRFTLCIVGGRPHESLKRYCSEKIIVTGFVPDIRVNLAACVCKVVPLRQGAGIKVKVIEAMSAGVPVLSNTIGIEGIPALHDTDYLHCETPEDYKAAFEAIAENTVDLMAMSCNAKKLIAETFNLDTSYTAYRTAIENCIERKSRTAQ
jgi:glycosyltransferase involved in cell wall biosynthesis